MKRAADFYLLRTTLLPVDLLDLKADKVEALIKCLLDEPYFIESIYLASPGLYAEAIKWKDDRSGNNGRTNKVLVSIYKYLLRMCSRPVPFGLFAGCSLGEIKDDSQVVYGDIDKHIRLAKIDTEILEEIVSGIISEKDIRDNATYYANNSFYKCGDHLRYTQYQVKADRRLYELQSVRTTPYLERIIETAKRGAPFAELLGLLTKDGIDAADALNFLYSLIDAQVLISELEPSPIEEDQLRSLIEKLRSIDKNEMYTHQLESIHQCLQDQKYGIAKYKDVAEKVSNLLPSASSVPAQVDLQVHMKKNHLNGKVIDEIVEAVGELQVLSYDNDDADLSEFKKLFLEKFDQREIPLSLALDNEFGIGYGEKKGILADYHPLFAKLDLKARRKTGAAPDPLMTLQLKKLKEALRTGKRSVQIEPAEISSFKTFRKYVLPNSLYVMGSLLAEEASQIDDGNYLFELTSFFGPPAANLMARFANGDEELKQRLSTCVDNEQQLYPDVVFAEVVHIPNSKAGNIISRPPLRNYEIPYLANGSSNAQKIPVDDLLVSIREDEIILRSKTLNKRVIPRLTTAHNFHFDSLPLYRFLCDLQSQKTTMPFNWSWGMLENEEFLPRLTYKKIILQKARWLIRLADYPDIKTTDASKLDEVITSMRTKLGLPQRVCISYGDNQLAIDLENPLCQQILQKEISGKRKIGLTEYLYTRENCFVVGENKRYCNELIIPVLSEQLSQIYHSDRFSSDEENYIERSFVPGSHWLYYKIYCGTATADRVLLEHVSPIVKELEKDKLISRWFFIRYLDPEPHLRIRFYVNDTQRVAQLMTVLSTAFSALTANGMVHKIQIDTYTREIERYGSDRIELSETVFHLDSRFVLNTLPLVNKAHPDLRFLAGIKGINSYLNAADLEQHEKLQLIKDLQDSFFEEFRIDKNLMKQINTEYRRHIKKIERVMSGTEPNPGEAMLLKKTEAFADSLKMALEFITPGENRQRLYDLLGSYLHMFINRLFISNQRRYELMLYSFLFRYYEGQRARQRQFTNKTVLG